LVAMLRQGWKGSVQWLWLGPKTHFF
jgi:hypothetical protein